MQQLFVSSVTAWLMKNGKQNAVQEYNPARCA
jgi:hypothetical protein